MGGEREQNFCGCFSAAAAVRHKRYNGLVKEMYKKVRARARERAAAADSEGDLRPVQCSSVTETDA